MSSISLDYPSNFAAAAVAELLEPGGGGHPDFDSLVNPIPIRGTNYSH